MSDSKIELVYFRGRGRAELQRWLLSAAALSFVNVYLDTPEELDALRVTGQLMFNQLPLLRIDAAVRGPRRGRAPLGGVVFADDRAAYIESKVLAAVAKFYPHFEREALTNAASNGDRPFLVGDSLSVADVALAMTVYHLKEYTGSDAALSTYPAIARVVRNVWELPVIQAFLASPQRCGTPDAAYVKNVHLVLGPLRPKLRGIAGNPRVQLLARLLRAAGLPFVWEDATSAAQSEGWEARFAHEGVTLQGVQVIAEYVVDLLSSELLPAARSSAAIVRSVLQSVLQALPCSSEVAAEDKAVLMKLAARILRDLDTAVTGSSLFLFGHTMSAADVALASLVEQLQVAGVADDAVPVLPTIQQIVLRARHAAPLPELA